MRSKILKVDNAKKLLENIDKLTSHPLWIKASRDIFTEYVLLGSVSTKKYQPTIDKIWNEVNEKT